MFEINQKSYNRFDPNFLDERKHKPVRGSVLLEWEGRIKYPCLRDGQLVIKIPQGLIRTLDDAATSIQWQLVLGRKSKQRLELIKDIAALLFMLVPQQVHSQQVEGSDHNSYQEEELSDILNTLPHSGEDSIDISHSSNSSNERDLDDGSNALPQSREYSIKRSSQSKGGVEQLLDAGFVRWSDSRLRPYYDNKTVIGEVMSTLSMQYILPGHNTPHAIVELRTHGKRKYLRIDPFLLQQRRIEYVISRQKFAAAYRSMVRLRWEKMQADPLLLHSYDNFTRLEKPSIELIEQKLMRLIGTEHKGKLITTIQVTPKPWKWSELRDLSNTTIWIEDWLDLAKKYAINNSTAVFRSKFKPSRHYSAYSMMPSKVREMLKFNGSHLVWVDVSSCHQQLIMTYYRNKALPPTADIINHIINAPLELSDEERHPRTRFAILAGIPDNAQLKIGINSWLNCKDWEMFNSSPGCTEDDSIKFQITRAFRRIGLHDFVDFIASWKRKYGYTSISKWLLCEEARLMDRALAKCYEQGIFCQGVHDGIDTERDRVDDVRMNIMDSFAFYGYPCVLKDDRNEIK